MGEQTDSRIKKETELNPEFQKIRESIKKLKGLNRYMTFPFKSQDLQKSFYDNFCYGTQVKEELGDMEFSLILKGILSRHTKRQLGFNCRGFLCHENIMVTDYGLLLYGHSVLDREQTYMEIVYKGTKSVYETYYKQCDDGSWGLVQAVNKRGEVFNPEELALYKTPDSDNVCFMPRDEERKVELTKQGLSIGYVSHKEI